MAVNVTADADRVTRAVCGLLAEHLRAAVRYGPDYARRYAEAAMTRPSNGTARETRLHPAMAKLVRELVQDELGFERRSGYSSDHGERRAA